jgi:hypothetical protein
LLADFGQLGGEGSSKTDSLCETRTNATSSLGCSGKADITGSLRRFFRCLGPGLITGAADDDPSGISTYSVTGAAFGYAGLWTALFSFPLMAAVQRMCARLGMVTGQGLASVIRGRHPAWVLWFACALLIVANVFKYRGGSRRNGGRDADGYWHPVLLLDTVLRIACHRALISNFLPGDGAYF